MMKSFLAFLKKIPVPYRNRLDPALTAAAVIALVAGAGLIIWFLSGETQIDIAGREYYSGPRAPITDLPCENPNRRPIAVMVASDPEARPLSGIGSAEMVIEMPVTPSGITRMMAVFQCNRPDEVGSIRSARQDFLGLVQGMDAVYAHWGGERDALESLDTGFLDNIDALIYEGTVFYRKPDVPPPHNGFTTLENLSEQAEKLGYDDAWNGSFWPHRVSRPRRSLLGTVGGLTITYPTGSEVAWSYDRHSNLWSRSRDGSAEIDALTGEPVQAGAVITLFTDSEPLRDQYVSVRMEGTGEAALYQDGLRQSIRWERSSSGMLALLDENGMPVGLAPGPIWIAVVTQGITVK